MGDLACVTCLCCACYTGSDRGAGQSVGAARLDAVRSRAALLSHQSSPRDERCGSGDSQSHA